MARNRYKEMARNRYYKEIARNKEVARNRYKEIARNRYKEMASFLPWLDPCISSVWIWKLSLYNHCCMEDFLNYGAALACDR